MDSLIPQRLVAIAATVLVAGVAAAPAHGQDETSPSAPSAKPVTRLVTYAARVCDRYTDVTANLARNDIQESLEDLGPDSLYRPGEAISAAKEAAGQPACRPLPNWQFTLGTSYQTRAVLGPWGALARVLNPYTTSIVTQAAVPLLNAVGNDTGASLAGAVTVALTPDQADRASKSSGLWLQGGTPTDPVLDQRYPGEYGFAALRCAVDNLNGDNVEWIAYPEGATHVFCFAYYVKPPPTSGTIIVRKVVDDPTVQSAQAFAFTGNISYTEDHRFILSAAYGKPGEVTFYRGAVGPDGTPWSFKEEVPDGWRLTGLECQSAMGTSRTTTDVTTGEAAVTLAGGDTVTCTYTDSPAPPPATLQLAKRTIGGVGSFDFTVTGPDSARQTIVTTAEELWSEGTLLTLEAGRYQVSEEAPAPDPAGTWKTTQVICDGTELAITDPISITLSPGDGSTCGFTNTFVPGGSLTIRKRTIGRTGSVGFMIVSVEDPTVRFEQVADVRNTGEATRATGDDTSHIALGTYRITEFATRPPATGAWQLESVICNGRPVTASRGQAEVRLTREQPKVDCTFTDRFSRDLDPDNPPIPTRTVDTYTEASQSELSQSAGPFADLEITKEVSPRTLRVGQIARYRVVVVNHGPDPASEVTVADLDARGTRALRVHTTQGACDDRRPVPCRIGTLQPGERAEITATVRPRRVGRVVDRVATVSSTLDPTLTNNLAKATVRVRPPAPESGATLPAYTG
jgi:uncharacterized repeat protein (TIGR01451 family)